MMISVVAGITGVIAVVAFQHHAFGLHLQQFWPGLLASPAGCRV